MLKTDTRRWESISGSMTHAIISEKPCLEVSIRVWSNRYDSWRTITTVVERERLHLIDGGLTDHPEYRVRWPKIMEWLVRDLETLDPK